MRAWLGAVAAVALVLVAPGVAAAGPDDPAQIQFKLPNRAAIAEFESLGLNMDHAIHDTSDGGALVSAWVSDAQLAMLKMRGYEPVAMRYLAYLFLAELAEQQHLQADAISAYQSALALLPTAVVNTSPVVELSFT